MMDKILTVLNDRYDDMDRDRLVFGQAYAEGYLDALVWVEELFGHGRGHGQG